MNLWIILALTSAILSASKYILSKKYLKELDLNPVILLFFEYLVSIILIIIFTNKHLEFSNIGSNFYLLIIKSLGVASFTLIYLRMLKKYEISLVSPMLNLSPLILMLLSITLLQEMISTKQLIGVLLIITATFLLSKLKQQKSNDKIKNKMTFFLNIGLALIIVSISSITDKAISNVGISPYTNLLFTALLSFIPLLIYLVINKQFKIIVSSLKKEPKIVIVSIVSFLSSLAIVYAISIPEAKVSLAIPLKRTSTLYTSIIGGLIFREKKILKKSILIILMFLGVILITT